MVTDDEHSVLVDASTAPVSEQFLDRLSAAEKARQDAPEGDEARVAALMLYAGIGVTTPQWSETEQPSGLAFLDRPRGESETPGSPPAELAIN